MKAKRNKILVVMPTRKRPSYCLSAAASVISNSDGYADVLLCVDPDDDLRITAGRVSTLVMPERMPMLRTIDAAYAAYGDDYDVFGFTGDDVIYRTEHWDSMVLEILRHQPGVVYGHDHIQGENLPTHPWWSVEIMKSLGRATPPKQRHYYFDNYLKSLAQGCGMLHFRNDILTEHLHHSVGGVPYDNVYREAELNYASDRAAFEEYLRTGLNPDIEKLTQGLAGFFR